MWQKQKPSIVSRIVAPLLITAILQSVLIVGMLSLNGVFEQLRENALSMLDERTQNKHQSLEAEMSVNWSSLLSTQGNVLDIVENTLATQGKSYEDIAKDAALNATLSREVAAGLISLIRGNDTTGVFIIFNGIGVVGRPDTYAGVYIRDTDPSGDAADNSDLHLLRGLPPVSRELGISLDSFWSASYSFSGGEGNPDNSYFFKPLRAAQAEPSNKNMHYGFWSAPFQINGQDDGAQITYSEPLVNSAGKVYGVIGVELSEDYLISVLNEGEFARSNRGCYFLGITEDGGKTYRKVTTGGAKYKQYFHAEDPLLVPNGVPEDGKIVVKSTRTGEMLRGSVYNLKLYAANTAFSNQQWVIIGLEDESTLFAFMETVRGLFIMAAVLAAAFGGVVSMLTGRGIVRPIIRLVDSLKTSDPNEKLTLGETNIVEIDQLADAILALNRDVIEAATRLSRILRLSGLPVGVFEVRDDSDVAYCSDDVFSLLGRADLHSKNNLLPKIICQKMVEQAMTDQVEESIYRLQLADRERYIRIKRMPDQHGMVGTLLDVTQEMEDRRRIERERDHDLLTGILNRRAFESDAEAFFIRQDEVLGVAAMIMLDLDNLKFLNDTYGHDCGDGYIRAFATSLRLFGNDKALVARRSGDEFYVFLYGGTSKEKIRERIRQAWSGILESYYLLPDGTPYKMRVSAGVAWYPENAKCLAQLIHYADFAMYKVKRSSKGTLEEFNAQDYIDESFLISGRDALDRLIDQQMVRFALQPILSARTGDVYGYELLMRTYVRELPEPLTVLRLATAEGKLPHIERLTWMKGLEAAKAMLTNRATPSGVLFFLNSIANQKLNADDERFVEEHYAQILPMLVLEVTEQEKNDPGCTEHKLKFVKQHGGHVAIDDYGKGYNSELALVEIESDIVKIDISFVHNVDTDVNKQTLIHNLISYAKQRGIAVLAEGVETREEMRTLIRFGVDYLQGFYLGQPQFQPMNANKQIKREIRRMVGEEYDMGDADD